MIYKYCPRDEEKHVGIELRVPVECFRKFMCPLKCNARAEQTLYQWI